MRRSGRPGSSWPRLRATGRGPGSGAALGPGTSSRRAVRLCERGYTNKRATYRRSRLPSSNGSGLIPPRRGRWSGSPSSPSGPASLIGSLNSGAARPWSKGRWRATGSSSGATSRSTGAAERSAMARRAEDAGRRHEARALYVWALAANKDDLPAREALARLDRAESRTAIAVLSPMTSHGRMPLAAARRDRAEQLHGRPAGCLQRRGRGRRPAIRLRQWPDAVSSPARALWRRPGAFRL